MDLKRKAEQGALVPVAKKTRQEVSVYGGETGAQRTSNLDAPIMLLSGHEGEVFSCKFSPDGSYLASSGFDRLIYLWDVYGECENFHVMKGHSGAVMELKFSTDAERMYTASTDKTIGVWDMTTGEKIKKLKGHQTFVNSCDVARRGPQVICSGSDDGTVRVWDGRKKQSTHIFQNNYQVTSCTFNDTAEQVISGGLDNDIKNYKTCHSGEEGGGKGGGGKGGGGQGGGGVWDLRKNDILFRMRGHTDTVTGIELSPDGSYLLSTAMDNTVRVWDVRPFAPQERCVKIYQGNQHNFEKNLLHCAWSPDGSKVTAGSGDRFVYIWDTTSRRILYKLPGHTGSINEVDFHPTENIVASCSSDKKIFLGEIE